MFFQNDTIVPQLKEEKMKNIQKHKKSFLWFSIIATILIVLIIAFVCIFDIRTINVPDDAVWKGNSKEAFWIQKVSSDDSAIRFRIYNDYDDKMILDADFYSPGYEDNIIDSINYFDHFKNEIILLNGKEMKMRKVYFQK